MGEPSERTVTVAAGEELEVRLGFGHPGFCESVADVLLPTGSSFIASNTDNLLAFDLALVRLTASSPEALLVVGHTDETGSTSLNDALSERRARVTLAVLTDRPAEWEDVYRTERGSATSRQWGDADFEEMLRATGAAVTPAAVSEHRELTAAGQVRREVLFRDYFEILRSGAPPPPVTSLTPAFLGCGENHTLGSGTHAPSRRGEFFFFRGTPPATVSCADYASWLNPCAPIFIFPVVDVFFVSNSGDDGTGDGSSSNPWLTLFHSLLEIERLRTPGRPARLTVMPGVYDDNVSLPSDFTLAPPLPGLSLPEIVGSSGDAVLTIGPDVRNVTVESLRVTDGRRSGIRIEEATGITVRICEIADNEAPRGGGISIVDSTDVTIEDNIIRFNTAGDIASAVTSLIITTSIFDLTRFEIELGDSHGGGLYVESSSDVSIVGNRIGENRAILFGGGIAVDNEPGFSGAILIENNEITCNQVAHGDLSDLGVEVDCEQEDLGDPLQDRFEEEVSVVVSTRAVALLHGVGRENGVGGGIALRHVSPATVIKDNRIGTAGIGGDLEAAPNRARRGGGVSSFVGGYPRLEGNTIAFNLASDDGGGIAIDQFDPFLPESQPTFLGFSRGRLFPRRTILMLGNSLLFNRVTEDGGGLYATGGALVEIEGGLVEGNRAGENGGGLRASYAVVMTVKNATLRDNRANTIRPLLTSDREGGGGLAARNASVTCEGCTLEDNVANEFAGGGAFLNSAFEGGFDEGGFIENESGQFDEIMEVDYGFRERHYEFVDCRGSDNRATDDSGAGGYLYAVRVEGDERIEVVLRGAATAIGVDTSEHDSGKRGNVVVELSGRTDSTGRPEDLVSIHGDVPSVPAGIAVSIPSPGAAVRIIPGGGRPHLLPTSFPFQNVPPLLGTVFPPFGATVGGTTVNLFGEAFLPGAEVFFDSVLATVISENPNQIVVETPPGAAGLITIEIVNPDGQRGTFPDSYTYTPPPQIFAVSPPTGPTIGGTRLTVEGDDFLDLARVLIGGVEAEVESVATDRIVALTPPAATGPPVDVEVINPDGQSEVVPGAFLYLLTSPRVFSINPSAGTEDGGTLVTIAGDDFLPGARVFVGGSEGTVISVSAAGDEIVFESPPGVPATSNDVEITNPDGQTVVETGVFTFNPRPEIIDVLPRAAPAAGGTVVTVIGGSFQPGVTLFFGSQEATSVVFHSATEIDATTPFSAITGPVDLTVVNPDNGIETVPGGFVFE